MHQANGSSFQNGDTSVVSNGTSVAGTLKKELVFLANQDKDAVRLIGQYLKSLGLNQTAETLVKESGVPLEHPIAARIRSHVSVGHWNRADAELTELSKMLKREDNSITEMRYLLLEQKYLELLEDGKILDAVHCLRHEITPLKYNTHRVHQLSICMMCDSAADLREAAGWPGKGLKSRQIVLDKVQEYLPTHIMLPSCRLQTIVDQSLAYQIDKCKYHNTSLDLSSTSAMSLLSDHACSREDFPSACTQVVSQHCDQVWFCKFSPDGSMLATGSKDGVVYIWLVNAQTHEVTLKYQLDGHNYGVAYLAWCPDSTYLIACGPDDCADVWLWNCLTGELKIRMTHATEDSLTCAAFHKDGKRFVTGGTRGQFYQCDLDGNVLDSWEGVRVQCLACLNDNKTTLASDSHYRLRAYNFEDLSDQHILQENRAIVSFSLSDDGRYALLNVDSEGIHIWDLNNKSLVKRLRGIKHGFFAIHSSFGGLNQDYVVSGSEDKVVYIWHRKEETPLCTLEGHTSTVNCVDWNPVHPSMIVSASDDCTVRIWGPSRNTASTSSAGSSSNTTSTSRHTVGENSVNTTTLSLLSGRSTPV